jgi:hypothetical protein
MQIMINSNIFAGDRLTAYAMLSAAPTETHHVTMTAKTNLGVTVTHKLTLDPSKGEYSIFSLS